MTKKVLVVEDNELNLKLFCDLLRAHGYEAEPVRDGNISVDAKLAVLEQKYDAQFKVVFDAIRALMEVPKSSETKIGFGRDTD